VVYVKFQDITSRVGKSCKRINGYQKGNGVIGNISTHILNLMKNKKQAHRLPIYIKGVCPEELRGIDI